MPTYTDFLNELGLRESTGNYAAFTHRASLASISWGNWP